MKLVRKNFIVLVAALLMTCMFAEIQVQAATTPGKVTVLEQAYASKNKIGVKWKLLNDDVGYRVALKTTTGSLVYSEDIDDLDYDDYDNDDYEDDDDGLVTINNLTSGTSYIFSIQAYSLKSTQIVGSVSEIEVVTGPAGDVSNFKQETAKTTSISLTWSAAAGASGYEIEIQKDGSDDWANPVYVVGTRTEFKNLRKDSVYNFRILPVRKSKSFTAEGGLYDTLRYVPTLPTKVTGLKYTAFNDSRGMVSFNCGKRATADGYQCNIYDGNRLIATTDSKSNTNIKIQSTKIKKKNKFFNAQVRAYVNVNGVKQFGDFSDKIFLSSDPVEKVKRTSGGLRVSWKKINGSSNYTVYISNKRNSGFKKVGNTSKDNLIVKKYGNKKLQKGKTYYIYVVANKKVGQKTHTSLSGSGVSIRY